jgi:hypothetical protein
MKQMTFLELTHDDGTPVFVIPSQVFVFRDRRDSKGCYVISSGGTPLPVRESAEQAKQAYQVAMKAEESQG